MQTAVVKLLIGYCLLDIFFFVQILAPSLDLNSRFASELNRQDHAFVKLITSGQMDVTPAMPEQPVAPTFLILCEVTPAVLFVTRDFHFTPGRDPPACFA